MSNVSKSEQVSQLRRIHQICSEFEGRCQSGEVPAIESYLSQVDASMGESLFVALLESELELRQERGEQPSKADYLARFPDFAALIDATFAAAQAAGAVSDTTTPGHSSETIHFAQGLPGSQRIRIGRYQIVREIARGGMGIVYFARDETLGREVALKVIVSGHLAAPSDLQRFELEGRAIARLDHPGIVRIYEFGEWAGHQFLAMSCVDGHDLAKALEGGRIDERQAAEWLRDLADAVDYAHQAGVVHRDLKPRNIMIDRQNRPRITDFGLAKLSHESPPSTSHATGTPSSLHGMTSTGQILGTPHYMSPEQAAGRHHEVGPLTDVYALGVILYEMLGGRVPFTGESAFVILQAIQSTQPPQLGRLRPALSRDLITICEKCMEKDPRRRYATAAGLRDDLDRFLTGLPIHARPISRLGRLRRWSARNPVLASLTFVLISVVLGALLTLSTILVRLRQESHDKALALAEARQAIRQREGALRESHANELLAQQRAYAARMMAASTAWNNRDVTRVTDLLESTLPQEGVPDFRGFEWNYLHRHVFHNLVDQLQFEGGEIGQIEFSSDGSKLLACGGSERNGFCEIVNLVTHQRLGRFDQANSIINVAKFSPTDERIVVGIPEKGLVLFDATLSDVVAKGDILNETWRSLAWSPDGRMLAAGSQRGTVVFWRFPDMECVTVETAHTGPVLALCFSTDGAHLYSSTEWSSEGRLGKQWDLATWPPVTTKTLPGFAITDVSDAGDEQLGTSEGTLARIDHATRNVIASRQVSRGFLVPPRYLSGSDRILAAARSDRVIAILARDSLETLTELPLRNSPTALATAESQGLLASGDVTGMVRIWQNEAGIPNPRASAH